MICPDDRRFDVGEWVKLVDDPIALGRVFATCKWPEPLGWRISVDWNHLGNYKDVRTHRPEELRTA